MAKEKKPKKSKDKKQAKLVLERVYNVPLRHEFLKVPKYKRARKSILGLKKFLIRHMKPEKEDNGQFKVKIGKYLNLKIWEHGIKNPPHHVKLIAKKFDDGLVFAELEGAPAKEEKIEEKLVEKAEQKKEEKSEKKEEKKEEAKAEKKEGHNGHEHAHAEHKK